MKKVKIWASNKIAYENISHRHLNSNLKMGVHTFAYPKVIPMKSSSDLGHAAVLSKTMAIFPNSADMQFWDNNVNFLRGSDGRVRSGLAMDD